MTPMDDVATGDSESDPPFGEPTLVVFDPTAETAPAGIRRIARPASLDGLTVGLVDITKGRGDVFLDRLADRLGADGHAVERFRKPTFTKPAPRDLREEITERCHVVVQALAD